MYKKIFLILLLQIIFLPASFSQIKIKSLKSYTYNESSLPVISNGETLKIQFDVESDYPPDFNIIFRFCDRNWKPVDNLFLINYNSNIAYDLDLVNLPFTVEDARYHFRGQFPNSHDVVEFPFSGKWIFYITDSQDTSKVYETGRFYVINNDVSLKVTLKKELLEDKVYSPLALGRIFNITTDFILPNKFFPSYVNHVEIIENKKIFYPQIIDRKFNTNQRQYYWDGNKKFTFIARDIRPGNEYRQVDIRDHNKFIGKNVKAQFDGIEYSRFHQPGSGDLNGGSVLMNYKNDYATYLNVTFSFRPPYNYIDNIFLTGEFNDWLILPEYKLENIGGVYSVTIPLKRGIYDYQYVTADDFNNQITDHDWLLLEGNFWETQNVYHIFLYYEDPDYGGYDRIIGYQRIISK